MRPTGPAPKTATVSPGRKLESVRPCQPVGKMSARRAKEDSCAVPGGRVKALKSAKGTRRYCAFESEGAVLAFHVSLQMRAEGGWCRWEGIEAYLTTGIRTHSHVTVCTACKAGVHSCAEGSVAFFAVLAAAVCYIEWKDDSVALFQKCNTASCLLDDAHVLMACLTRVDLV